MVSFSKVCSGIYINDDNVVDVHSFSGVAVFPPQSLKIHSQVCLTG